MKRFAVCLTGLVFALSAGRTDGASFLLLGDLPGGPFASGAADVSADGAVVVGSSDSGGPWPDQAFGWTEGTGMVGLGFLSSSWPRSWGNAVSSDGSVVVGNSYNEFANYNAFRWTQGTGMVALGALPGGLVGCSGEDVSDDGSVIVGYSESAAGPQASYWTDGGAPVGLGDLPGGDFWSYGRGVSADGSAIVGESKSASGREAFRWTAAEGMVGLGDLPGGDFESAANRVSCDGLVVVGYGTSASGKEAFRWTAGGGMIGLGDLVGGEFDSCASDVSADGSVLVGRGSTVSGYEALVWDSVNGMWSLQEVLTVDFGLDLTGWTLLAAYGISPDGNAIVGSAENPSGQTEAWLAILPLKLNWSSESGGAWDSPDNWHLAETPARVTNVFIEPAIGLTVTGPAEATTITSLTLGAQTTGTATLHLQETGTLNVNGQTTITPPGRITGDGILNAVGGILNSGEIDLGTASLQLLGGTLVNEGVIRGNGQIDNPLENGADGEVRVGRGEYILFTGSSNTNAGKIEVLAGEIEFTHGLTNEALTGFVTGRDATLRFGTGLNNAGSVGISFGTTDIFGDVANTGTIVLTGNSTTTFYGHVTNDGEFRVSPGSTVVLVGDELINNGLIQGSAQIHNTLINGATGEVRVGAGQRLVFTGSGNTSAGKIEVIGGEIEFTQGLANETPTALISAEDAILRFGTGLNNEGSVEIASGTTDVFGDLINTGTIELTGNSNVTVYDDLTNDGTFQVKKRSTVVFFGDFGGTQGTTGQGTVFMEGDLRPGSSTAAISFGGDLIFGGGATLEIELGGTEAGTQHDAVNVAGLAALNGTLQIVLIDGFRPSLGDNFEILTYGSVEGGFTEYRGLELGNGLRLQFNFTESGCVSSVVPEPSTLMSALLAAGLLGIAPWYRRRTVP
jgi:probable HAF family extracellular repeat protein